MTASDNRNPAKTATATVTINVVDVTFSPVWVNAPFSVSINIDQNVNSPVNALIRATKQNAAVSWLTPLPNQTLD